MAIHPNQLILGAVQEGQCSEIDDKNPYNREDKKRSDKISVIAINTGVLFSEE